MFLDWSTISFEVFLNLKEFWSCIGDLSGLTFSCQILGNINNLCGIFCVPKFLLSQINRFTFNLDSMRPKTGYLFAYIHISCEKEHKCMRELASSLTLFQTGRRLAGYMGKKVKWRLESNI